MAPQEAPGAASGKRIPWEQQQAHTHTPALTVEHAEAQLVHVVLSDALGVGERGGHQPRHAHLVHAQVRVRGDDRAPAARALGDGGDGVPGGCHGAEAGGSATRRTRKQARQAALRQQQHCSTSAALLA